jgi:hypothetical protein
MCANVAPLPCHILLVPTLEITSTQFDTPIFKLGSNLESKSKVHEWVFWTSTPTQTQLWCFWDPPPREPKSTAQALR